MNALDHVQFFGPELKRPECVVATASGDFFVSDGRGGVMLIRADGTHQLTLAQHPPAEGFIPNGIALLPDRSILAANVGMAGGVWQLFQDGKLIPYLLEVENAPIPQVNFVGIDGENRVWITVSTHKSPIAAAAYKGMADGYIIVKDAKGARIVAKDIGFANEAKVDPSGKFLYAVETIGRRLIRFPIGPDAALGRREIIAEFTKPAAFPDGLCFDEEGGVWVTTIIHNGIVRVTPDGQQHWALEDTDHAHAAKIEAIYQAGEFGGWTAGENRRLKLPTSMCFGGEDLRTGYIGFLHGDRLASFTPGVKGARPPHWNF